MKPSERLKEIEKFNITGLSLEDVHWLINRVRTLTEAISKAREGFALMAEGEGSDPQVYVDMANYHMKQLDKILKGNDE